METCITQGNKHAELNQEDQQLINLFYNIHLLLK